MIFVIEMKGLAHGDNTGVTTWSGRKQTNVLPISVASLVLIVQTPY
jgi:hypothetical protein